MINILFFLLLAFVPVMAVAAERNEAAGMIGSLAELLSADPQRTGTNVYVIGRRGAHDGFEGYFTFNDESAADIDGGTILGRHGEKGRWIRHFSGPMNVRWFGARGDGGTADDAAIQRCLDAASVRSKAVYIPRGSYYLTNSLVIRGATDLSIQGDGGNASALVMGAEDLTILHFTNTCERVTLRDLWIGSFRPRSSGFGLSVDAPDHAHASGLTVSRCRFQNLPSPIRLKNVDHVVFENVSTLSTMENASAGDAVQLFDCLSVRIRDCFFTYSGKGQYQGATVRIDQNCDTIVLDGVEVGGGKIAGVLLDNSRGATGPRLTRLSKVYVEGSSGPGIWIRSGRDVVLEGCHAAVNKGSGFLLTGGTSLRLSDCLALQNHRHGYEVNTNAVDVSLSNCTASNNSQAESMHYDGVCVGSGLKDVRVENCRSGDFIFKLATRQRYGLSIGERTEGVLAIGNNLRDNALGAIGNFSASGNNLITSNLP